MAAIEKNAKRANETNHAFTRPSSAIAILVFISSCLLFLTSCTSKSDNSFKDVLGSSPQSDPFGQNGNATISFTPVSTDFGVVRTMTDSNPASIVVKNLSSISIYLQTIGTPANTNYRVTASTCPLSPNPLPSGQTCLVTIVFNPQTTGTIQWTFGIIFGIAAGGTDYQSFTAVKGLGATNVNFAGIDSIDMNRAASVRLKWTDVVGENGFMIFKVDPATQALQYVDSAAAASTSYVVTGLTPNSSYTFRVKAIDLFGQLDSNVKNVSAMTSLAPVLTAQAPLTMASVTGPLVVGQTYTFDFDNIAVAPGNDINMSYSCYYDTAIDASVMTSTACSSIAGITLDPSFSTNGRLSWTPDATSGGKAYEILVRGNDGSMNADRVFGVNVRDAYVRSNLAYEIAAPFANSGMPNASTSTSTMFQNLYNFGGSALDGTLTGTFLSRWLGDGTDQTNPYRLKFDGTSGALASRVTLANPIATTGNYAFSTWIKPTNTALGTDAYVFYNGGVSINGWSIRQDTTGIYQWDFGTVSDYQTTVLAQTPTAFYKFEETSGTSIADSSGNGNTGALQNGAGLTYAVSGHDNNAFTFASNAYVRVGPISIASGNYSISAWVLTPLPTNGVWKTVTRGNAGDHQIIFNSSTNEFGTYFNATAFSGSGFMANSLTAGWHLFTTVGSAAGTTWYVDGVQGNSVAYKSTTDIYAIGNYQAGGQPAGSVDGVAIWNRSLSASEVSSQFSANCSVSIPQGYWAQIAGIYNGSTISLFKNGNQVCQVTPQGVHPNSGLNPSLGAKPDGSNAWPGELADFRVHTSLTSTDVTTNFTATKTHYLSGPASISNLQIWVDATDPNNTGIAPSNGASITTWKDKSGGSRDLTSTGTTPTYNTSGLGASLPAVYYPGNGAHLSSYVNSGAYTIAYVARLEGTQNARVLGDYSGGNILFGYWGNYMKSLYLNGSPSAYNSSPAVAATTAKTNYLFVRTSGGAFKYYDNGTLLSSYGTSDGSSFKLEVGCGSGVLGECSKVYVSELIVYNRDLTAGEIAVINAYLTSKWGF